MALLAAIIGFFDWKTPVNYIGYRVNFVEPMFVVTIMTLAATRPILKLSETVMQKIADLLGGSLSWEQSGIRRGRETIKVSDCAA